MQSPKKPVNWGWIGLGGCFGLLLLLYPFIAMLLGMIIGAWQEERESNRRHSRATAEASEPVCLDVPPAVLARIEAALRMPDTRLRGVRAVHSTLRPNLWVIAADVEGAGYEREDNFAVWHLWQTNPDDASPNPDDPITAATGLAIRVSKFSSNLDTTLNGAAISCTVAALSGT